MKRIYNPTEKKTQSAPELQENPVAPILSDVPGTLAALRASHQIFARKQEENLRQAELAAMHQHVRSLTGAVGLIDFGKIAQMTNALEALLVHLHGKPNKITLSVIRTIAQAIDTLASLFDRVTDSQAEGLVPPRILVVDDEVISRTTICSSLGIANLTAVSLDDPLAAQHLLEKEHFDLIFLDVEMPGQSGLELCMKIREMTTNCATPVVFVTSHADFGNRAQSTLSGGNDFIAKPFLSAELAVKAFTCLFKESSPGPANPAVPVRAETHESQPSAGLAAPSVCEGLILEPNTAP
jgi:CheY-like chemotaxis protein